MNRILLCVVGLGIFACARVEGEEGAKGTSFFNQQWLKTLVSIEITADGKSVTPVGSGFLVETPGKHVALVTAKHVICDESGRIRSGLLYRLNNKENKSDLISEDHVRKLAGEWCLSKESDVACRLIVWGDKQEFATIPYSQFLIKDRIEAGAPLFVIGFPMGLRSDGYATAIVRRGMVARAEPKGFTMEAFVFPGNSGGPVVYTPDLPVGSGLTSPVLQGQWLAGMATSYLPYTDVAVSLQTKRARVTFEENSGLCQVMPAQSILDLLQREDFIKLDTKK